MDGTFVFVSDHRDPVRHHYSPTHVGPRPQPYTILGTPLWQEAAATLSCTGVRACCSPPDKCPGRGPQTRCHAAAGQRSAPLQRSSPCPSSPCARAAGHLMVTTSVQAPGSPRYKMKYLQFCHSIIYSPPFIRFMFDSGDSSHVEFVSSHSTQ
jgi:hypothetical protein